MLSSACNGFGLAEEQQGLDYAASLAIHSLSIHAGTGLRQESTTHRT